jgi:hypothetical protein
MDLHSLNIVEHPVAGREASGGAGAEKVHLSLSTQQATACGL